MLRHLVAHRTFSRRLRTAIAYASSGVGVCAVPSVRRARTDDVLAFHCPLLRLPFSRLATTVESRRLRLLNEPCSEQSTERPVSLGCAPEGAQSSRRRVLCLPYRGPVTNVREWFACLGSSACAPSAATIQSSCPGRAGPRSATCSAALHPPGPNPSFEGTAGKQGLPVPRRLRRRAAPQLKR